MMTLPRHNIVLSIVLLLAFLLRLLVIGTIDDADFSRLYTGGDGAFYMEVGFHFVGGYDYSQVPLPVAPLYLIVTGIPQQVLSFDGSIRAIWLFQSVLSIFSLFAVYRIAYRLTMDRRVALLSVIALAISLSYIQLSMLILTEQVYIFFVMCGLSFYIDGFMNPDCSRRVQYLSLALSGILLGFATLTRAITLLFPAGLIIHMVLIKRWRTIPILAVSAAFITFSWTAYTSLYYEWTTIGSNQLMAALWRGAVENDGSPRENDALLDGETYTEQSAAIITGQPQTYLQRRIDETTSAILQPHGTIPYGKESLKVLLSRWIESGFSLLVLSDLLNGEGFLPKLLIYIWHYVAMIGGVVGMWLTRRRWRISLVLIGFVVYTLLQNFFILALPRYIYPIYPIMWIFASVTLVAIWDRVTSHFKNNPSVSVKNTPENQASAL